MRKILLPIIAMLILSACNGKQSGKENPKWTDDTVATQGPKIIDPKQLSEVLPDPESMNFQSRLRKLTESLFGEGYKEDRMDVIEMTPRWSVSRKAEFKKYLRQQTISNDYGEKIYIRPVLKAWEFPDRATLEATLLEWLNGHENSDPDQIELGEEVKALKSPPFLCAVRDQEIFMLFSACVYSGKEWDELANAFMQEFDSKGTRYRFKVACGAGKLTYLSKTEDNEQI